MGYIEQERCIRLCDDLCGLLQDEISAVSEFLSGDIYEEYKKLLNLEIDQLMHLKKIIGSN